MVTITRGYSRLIRSPIPRRILSQSTAGIQNQTRYGSHCPRWTPLTFERFSSISPGGTNPQLLGRLLQGRRLACNYSWDRPFRFVNQSPFGHRLPGAYNKLYFYRSIWTPSTPSDKAALLRQAPNRWARARIHIRYALTRSFRPWTVDDMLGIFSWIFLSNTLFILIGTTTFFSLLLAIANGLSFEDYIARKLGDYLMTLTGATFHFESSISPSWSTGSISLRNVSMHLGPEYAERVKQTARQQVERQQDRSNQNPYRRFDDHYHLEHPSDEVAQLRPDSLQAEVDYTMYDLRIDRIDVTFSVWRWMDGKGLVKDCTMKGVRGVIDRSRVYWDPAVPYNPEAERAKHRPGNFELESFHLEDMLVYMYYPDNFPPFPISIFSASLPQLRQQWFLLDILSADSMVGSYSNCLFSIHRAQDPTTSIAGSIQPGRTAPLRSMARETPAPLPDQRCLVPPTETGPPVKRSHLRIDGVPVGHLNGGIDGPFGWITDGQVDMDAIITFPTDPHAEPIKKLVHGLADDLEQAINQAPHIPLVANINNSIRHRFDDQGPRGMPPLSSNPTLPTRETQSSSPAASPSTRWLLHEIDPQIQFDLQVTFRNPRASVPLQTSDLTYLNNALIRPIVAYMNANRTVTPIPCRFSMRFSDFDGSWSVYDSRFADYASAEIGKGIVQLAYDERERNRRLKRVGLWGVQMVTRNIIAVLEYARGKRGFWHYLGLVNDTPN
ncbi:Mitochondrial distribution and morphology protein 31, mitochondrial precursor [Dimargaris cristalligena]|nr:Mitochondrial distribution and morphology protein 31, mitochondrial precursor [Dimargaris cristalligena]